MNRIDRLVVWINETITLVSMASLVAVVLLWALYDAYDGKNEADKRVVFGTLIIFAIMLNITLLVLWLVITYGKAYIGD
jgi:hypothetical protein